MSAAEIVAEVRAEHKRAAYRAQVLGCSCGVPGITTDDAYCRHVAQLVAERLRAAGVGACGGGQ